MTRRPTLVKASDIVLAFALLSRLPMPRRDDWTRQAQAAWAYPLVGLVIGGASCLVGMAGLAVGLPPVVAAALVLATQIALSGAMHEDGLADTVDGFWGGWSAERRLEIMKDSQIGSYGVIALVLSLGLRWVALWMLWEAGSTVAIPVVIAAAMLSRMAMAAPLAVLPPARASGLSAGIGTVAPATALLALALGTGAALAILGSTLLPALTLALTLAMALVAGMIVLARRKIGGQTGDVLGATQQLAEITLLICLLP